MNRALLVSILAVTLTSSALAAPRAFESYVEKVSKETGRSEREVREDALDALRRDGRVRDADLERIGRGEDRAIDETKQVELVDVLRTNHDFNERTGLAAVHSDAISTSAARSFDEMKTVSVKNPGLTLSKAIKASYENGDLTETNGTRISPRTLKGDAAAEFKKMNKDWGPDYAPTAYVVDFEVPATKSTVKIIMIETNTDGGSYFSFYTVDGDLIIAGSQSESGTPQWSAVEKQAAAQALKTARVSAAAATPVTTKTLEDIAKTADVANGGTEVKTYDVDSFDQAKELKKLLSAKKDFPKCGPWVQTTTRRTSIAKVRKYANDNVTADALTKLYKEGKIAKMLSVATNNDIDCSRMWAKVFTTDGNVLTLYYGLND